MFGMFKDMGQLAGLLKQLPKIKEEMDRFQQRAGQLTAEASAGAPGTSRWLGKVVKPLARSTQDCEAAAEAVLALGRLAEESGRGMNVEPLDRANGAVSRRGHHDLAV